MSYSSRKCILAGTLILESLQEGYMGGLMVHVKITVKKKIYIYIHCDSLDKMGGGDTRG